MRSGKATILIVAAVIAAAGVNLPRPAKNQVSRRAAAPILPAAPAIPSVEESLRELRGARKAIGALKAEKGAASALSEVEASTVRARDLVREVAELETDYDRGRLGSEAYSESHRRIAERALTGGGN